MTHSDAVNPAPFTAPPTSPVPAASSDPRRLSEFLACHNPECPQCRYRLQGLTSNTCPECGVGLRLGILPVQFTAPHGPLHWPCMFGVVAGLVGALFATFIRREHDDWLVGVLIAVVSASLALPLWLSRRSLALMPRRISFAISVTLWIAFVVATAAAFFLDI